MPHARRGSSRATTTNSAASTFTPRLACSSSGSDAGSGRRSVGAGGRARRGQRHRRTQPRPLAARPDRGVRVQRASRRGAGDDGRPRTSRRMHGWALGARDAGTLPRAAGRLRRCTRPLPRIRRVARGCERPLRPRAHAPVPCAHAGATAGAGRPGSTSKPPPSPSTRSAPSVWSARTYAELRASGVSRRRQADHATCVEPTAHELRVARIVAEGASNREAAAALFLSPKTVEYHLASIYRKLGVRRRAELAAVATARGWLEPSTQLHVPVDKPAA